MTRTMAVLALAVAACLLTGRPATAQAPTAPAPPFLLVGVILLDAGEPMAILEDPKTHGQGLFTVGAQIGDVHLTKIFADHVVLTSGNVPIKVRLESPEPPRRTGTVPVRRPPVRSRRTLRR